MEHLTDIELIDSIGNGNANALDYLFEKHYMSVYRLAYRWCGIKEDAEDITQEVFIKLVRKLHTFNKRSSFRTWLYRITMNTAKDFGRKKTRELNSEIPMTNDQSPETHNPEKKNSISPNQLTAAIDRLPVKFKMAVILVLAEGYSHKEAAEVLECSEATVSWRIFQARKKLKTMLNQTSV